MEAKKKELRELEKAEPFNLEKVANGSGILFGSYSELDYPVYDESGDEVRLSKVVKKDGRFTFSARGKAIEGEFVFNGECFVCGDRKLSFVAQPGVEQSRLFNELAAYVSEIDKSFDKIEKLKANYATAQKRLDENIEAFSAKLENYVDKYIGSMTEEDIDSLEELLNSIKA